MPEPQREIKILLVEDESSIRFVAEIQFQALGYRLADFADNGLSAVEKALSGGFDIIFMDVKMPGIDGILATKRIREAEKGRSERTTIIGMTAFAEKTLCLDAGMDDYLQKPVFLNQLRGVMDKWLSDAPMCITESGRGGAREVEPSRFRQTAEDMNAMKDKVKRLRKDVGLD
ncbi:MAG TPA: response regulator [Chroococcales cyanobacterium]